MIIPPYPATAADIDWTNPAAPVAWFLSVKECLWLPQWERLANAGDGFDPAVQGQAIFDFVTGPLGRLGTALGLPFIVHVFYRPPAYNKLIGGAPASAHQALGAWAAVDFDLNGSMTCDAARLTINQMGYLDQFGLRMEDRTGSGWVHIDNHPPAPNRFFQP